MSDATTTQTSPTASSGAGVPMTGKPSARGIGIADSAVGKLGQLLKARGTPDAGLRVAVRGGGCSGLTYVIEWADGPRPKDKIFEREGVRLFVDSKSYLYLMGTTLSYESSLMASGFRLDNPNVKSACGCGDSFTV